MIDVDGSFSYSTIVKVITSCATSTAMLYPNPANNVVTVTNLNNITQIRLVNSLGQTVKMVDISQPATTIDIANLPASIYGVQLLQGGLVTQRMTLVKQ